jgi:hypothetical protein
LRSKRSTGSLLWPLALVIAGIALLLHNFLLLGGFNLTALWPLLLVLAGATILLRGDLLPSDDARTFGITRGSVESATLEISAGEIDVQARALQREGRLIAGQFAADSRPELQVTDTHAVLRMDRAATPWLSFADWDLGLTPDLPWQLFVSTSLGQVRLDLSGLVLADATIATGIGDIRIQPPQEAFGPLYLRSALGDIHVTTPAGYNTRITVAGARMFHVHADEERYRQPQPGTFIALDAAANAQRVEIHISGTFGDAYLS